ncbi:MAG: hypothetical protein H7240_01070 [Glaciimonas sp.]|nr:hypothetical protein [Glaciimonas sp.]
MRFAGVRAALRQILTTEYGLENVQIQGDRFGKPVLSLLNFGELAFNVSQSGDFGMISVSRAGQVGIDIEKLLPLDIFVLMLASLHAVRARPVSRFASHRCTQCIF